MSHKVTLLKFQSHFLLLFALVAMVSLGACKNSNNSQQTATKPAGVQAVTPDGSERANAYLKGVGKRIRIAIANGDISEEEGVERYNAAVERVGQRIGAASDPARGEKSKTANTDVRARYKEATNRMIEMVKAGEITREQMQTRLDGMKKRMGADKSKKISKEDYDLAASKMARMVKAGEITREQMEARLNRMKKAMASKDEPSDDCIELRKKLGEAVRNGEMTREEAGKIWEEEGC